MVYVYVDDVEGDGWEERLVVERGGERWWS